MAGPFFSTLQVYMYEYRVFHILEKYIFGQKLCIGTQFWFFRLHPVGSLIIKMFFQRLLCSIVHYTTQIATSIKEYVIMQYLDNLQVAFALPRRLKASSVLFSLKIHQSCQENFAHKISKKVGQFEIMGHPAWSENSTVRVRSRIGLVL